MNHRQLLKILLDGEPILVGKLIGSNVESPRWIDKLTGEVIEGLQVVHLIERTVAKKVIATRVYQRVVSFSQAEAAIDRFHKGDSIAFYIKSLSNSSGHSTACTDGRSPCLIENIRPTRRARRLPACS